MRHPESIIFTYPTYVSQTELLPWPTSLPVLIFVAWTDRQTDRQTDKATFFAKRLPYPLRACAHGVTKRHILCQTITLPLARMRARGNRQTDRQSDILCQTITLPLARMRARGNKPTHSLPNDYPTPCAHARTG